MKAGLGVCTGCLAWGLAAAVGLGSLLAASETAYNLLRIAGALYLAWLGLNLLLRPGRGKLAEPALAAGGRWFRRGLLTNLLNPKVGVFYVSFLPQFIPPGGDALGYSLVYAVVHAAEGLAWFAVLAVAARPLSRWLRSPRVLAAIDRLTGGVFLAFGARLALSSR
jgi:threonine/homoserine/homoserine lactone efflux protein